MTRSEPSSSAEATPAEKSLRWEVAAAHLFLTWHRAYEAELVGAASENRLPRHDAALTRLVQTARRDWPEEDCRRFGEAQLSDFRKLDDDLDIRAEIEQRGLSEAEFNAVQLRLRAIAAEVEEDEPTKANAVIAGLIGRLWGQRQRAAYVLDHLLDAYSEEPDKSLPEEKKKQ